MIKNAEYMRSVHLSKLDSELNSILDKIEKEALKGKSYVAIYMGNYSDDKKNQLAERIKLITEKLTYLGFDVKREFMVEWRLLKSNLVHESLSIKW